jgi:hypothetical protein
MVTKGIEHQLLEPQQRALRAEFHGVPMRHRLLTAKTKRCSCLHYSGHGHNTHLPFKNGKGGPRWLEVNVLRDLIEQNECAPFKFVFVLNVESVRGMWRDTHALLETTKRRDKEDMM